MVACAGFIIIDHVVGLHCEEANKICLMLALVKSFNVAIFQGAQIGNYFIWEDISL